MNRREIRICMGMIALHFENFELSEAMIDSWLKLIGHHDFEAAQIGINKLLLTARFCPRIADINDAIVDVTTPKDEAISSSEAWEMATKAVREAYSNPDREPISKLPKPIRDAVRAIGSWEIRNSQNPAIVLSQFSKLYQENVANMRKERAISPSLKQEIAAIGQNSKPVIEYVSTPKGDRLPKLVLR